MQNDTIWVKVSDEPISAEKALSFATGPGLGAEVLFLGAVREFNHGKKVEAVSYDAYVPMAEATLKEICEEARSKWGERIRVAVLHRTGRLGVGEASVAIAVGSPHRDEGYQASRYVIEELKVRATIWKKEHYEDGETEWLRGHALCSHGGDHSGGGHVHSHGAR